MLIWGRAKVTEQKILVSTSFKFPPHYFLNSSTSTIQSGERCQQDDLEHHYWSSNTCWYFHLVIRYKVDGSQTIVNQSEFHYTNKIRLVALTSKPHIYHWFFKSKRNSRYMTFYGVEFQPKRRTSTYILLPQPHFN